MIDDLRQELKKLVRACPAITLTQREIFMLLNGKVEMVIAEHKECTDFSSRKLNRIIPNLPNTSTFSTSGISKKEGGLPQKDCDKEWENLSKMGDESLEEDYDKEWTDLLLNKLENEEIPQHETDEILREGEFPLPRKLDNSLENGLYRFDSGRWYNVKTLEENNKENWDYHLAYSENIKKKKETMTNNYNTSQKLSGDDKQYPHTTFKPRTQDEVESSSSSSNFTKKKGSQNTKVITKKSITKKPLIKKVLTKKSLIKKVLTKNPLTKKVFTEKSLTEKSLTKKSITENRLVNRAQGLMVPNISNPL